jgi:hypothetical protein
MLRFTIQITNNASSNAMIDDKVCRLIVDSVPTAPLRGFGLQWAYAHAALREDLVFAFPTETKSAALQFWVRDESETISVNLPK